jgi:ADP-heptose:LPS heptosyltransferase
MPKPNCVLVLAAGSLGDCILTLPALHALQSRAPVTVIGTSPYVALGADLLGMEKVLPLEPLLQEFFTSHASAFLSRSPWVDMREIFVFFKDKEPRLLERLAALPGIEVHTPIKPFQEFLLEGRWAAEYWLETVLPPPLPAGLKFRQARLQISAEMKTRGREILKSLGLEPPFVIHPGSGSPQKNSPLSFFRTAAQKAVEESGRQVLVVWGEAEEKNIPEIRQTFAELKNVVVLPKPLALRDLAAVFSQSAAYLGNDSGVTQLASACGLRTFAVFNTTDTRVWAPQQAVILAAMKSLYSSDNR